MNPLCAECGWRYARKDTPAPRSEVAQASAPVSDDDRRPPPVISPDGRLFWDGQRWIAVPRRGPSLGGVGLFIVLALAVTAGIGTSGYVDLSGLPFSVPVVLEHCSVRYAANNVIVRYQGIDAASACRRAGLGWSDYSGPPLGSLACYQQRVLGLSWRVYDTGGMEQGSDVCARLVRQPQLTSGG